MSEYAFFVSDVVPGPAIAAMRSHAMKTALQLRSRQDINKNDNQSKDPRLISSQQTKRLKNGLKGKFRLASTSLGVLPRRRRKAKEASIGNITSKTVANQDNGPLSRTLPRLQENPISIQWFGSNAVDPFSTLPVSYNSDVDMLVKYCMRITFPRM